MSESAVEQDLYERLEKLRFALLDWEERVKMVGRWPALIGAGILLLCFFILENLILQNMEMPSFLFMFFSACIVAVAPFIKGHLKWALLIIGPSLVVIAFGKMILVNHQFNRILFRYEFKVVGPMSFLFSLFIMVVVLGPYASLMARRIFPSSHFVKRFGLITSLLWMPILIASLIGYYVVFRWHLEIHEIVAMVAQIIFALCGFAVPVLVVLSVLTDDSKKAKSMLKVGLLLGLLTLVMHVLLGVSWFAYCHLVAGWLKYDLFVFSIVMSICAGAIAVIMTTAMSSFLVQVAHSRWKKQVTQEIERLEIELGGNENPV